MIRNLPLNRAIWALCAALALLAAAWGVLNPGLYSHVVTPAWLPGTISQDCITVIAALGLLGLSLAVKADQPRLQIVALSLLAYLFYAYGIYVIEQLHTVLYLVYLAVFALAFWALVYGLLQVDTRRYPQLSLPKWVASLAVGFSVFIPVLFTFLWTAQLLPLMQTGQKLEFAFSVPILDLAFVMPAFLLCALLILKKQSFGLLAAPILFFKAFTLLFSVGLGGLLKPLYHQPAAAGETFFYLILAAVFLALSLLVLWGLHFGERQPQAD